MLDRTSLHVVSFEDLVDRVASFESFRVADKLYTAQYLIPQLTVNTTDLISEAASASSFAVYWGLEASRARRFKAQVDASYRQWRDRMWLDIKTTPLDITGKFPTDSQTDKSSRLTPEYGAWRCRIDDALESAEMAEAVYEAFKMKADLVKSLERIMSSEAGGAYFVVEKPNQEVTRTTYQGETVR